MVLFRANRFNALFSSYVTAHSPIRCYHTKKKQAIRKAIRITSLNIATLFTYYSHFDLFRQRPPCALDGTSIMSNGDMLTLPTAQSPCFLSSFARLVYKAADESEYLEECTEARVLHMERNASLPLVINSTFQFPLSMHAVFTSEYFFYTVLPLLHEYISDCGSTYAIIDSTFIENCKWAENCTKLDSTAPSALGLLHDFLKYLASYRQFVHLIQDDAERAAAEAEDCDAETHTIKLLFHPDILIRKFRIFQRTLKLPLPLEPETPAKVRNYPVLYAGQVYAEEMGVEEATHQTTAEQPHEEDPSSRMARLRPLLEKLKSEYARSASELTLKRINHIEATLEKLASTPSSSQVAATVAAQSPVVSHEVRKGPDIAQAHPIYSIMSAS